jgi:iron complex transport system substrate-binding protein
MMPRAGLVLPLLCGFFLLRTTCASAGISLPQSDGSILELESAAQRVITLAPNLAEMMFDAGAGSRLLATVEYSNFPEQAARLPRIGDAFRFDLEQIMALQPDLIIAWSSGNPAAALDRLDSLGFKVWRTELRRPLDIAVLLENIALATGSGAAGENAAQRVEARLEALEKRYSGKQPVRYFYQVAERPLFTLNGMHIVSQGLSLCGGLNVFADEPTLAPQISRESVLLADPDVLFAPRLPDSADPLGHWRSWPRLSAVRQNALYGLPADKISRATARMLDSLELACTLLDQSRVQNTKASEKS